MSVCQRAGSGSIVVDVIVITALFVIAVVLRFAVNRKMDRRNNGR